MLWLRWQQVSEHSLVGHGGSFGYFSRQAGVLLEVEAYQTVPTKRCWTNTHRCL